VDDSETDSEVESNHSSNEAGPSSKSLSSQLKDNKKTASLPKKKKKRKRIAEAWKYFEQEGSFAACQVEITKDGIKKNVVINMIILTQIQSHL
ncbi:23572_t:CDS:1, partial [Gigaspora rosea]